MPCGNHVNSPTFIANARMTRILNLNIFIQNQNYTNRDITE